MLVVLNSLSTLNNIRLQLWIKLFLLVWMGCTKKKKKKSVKMWFCPPVTAVIAETLKAEVACPEFVLGTECYVV